VSDKAASPLFTLAASITLVLIAGIAHAGIDSLNPMSWFVQKDATTYASKMVETVKDRPECQKFKDEIMSYAKGNPLSGKTTYPIGVAKQKATTAGCAK
jgi:hypothetical protein